MDGIPSPSCICHHNLLQSEQLCWLDLDAVQSASWSLESKDMSRQYQQWPVECYSCNYSIPTFYINGTEHWIELLYWYFRVFVL